MRPMRQNIQLTLPFTWDSPGESGGAHEEGTEVRAAQPETELPARVRGPSMEAVVEPRNLKSALAQVQRNKGGPGVDGMTVAELGSYLQTHWNEIISQLLEGRYTPQAVRRVEIPKPSGGVRVLGVPTVLDRFVQQALLQVLQEDWDETFSEASYGFRPRRSAHQAIAQAQEYVAQGYRIVVDMDLEKFFDNVNHDKLMGLVAKRVTDRRIRKLIRAFLTAGMLASGLVSQRVKGTPQGGPLSPLLSNVMLDVLDKELERRGHRFVRYADDCNIYVRSQRAGERVMESVTRFLARRLKLKVNTTKSAVGDVAARSFLGFTFTRGPVPRRRIAPKARERLKQRVRELTRRTRGVRFRQVIAELSRYLRGWRGYFGYCETPSVLRSLDGWIRRRLRAYQWHQWKTPRRRYRALRRLGVRHPWAATLTGSGHGPWRLSLTPALCYALPNALFAELDLVSLASKPVRSSPLNRRVRTRTHGGVGGWGP